MNGSMSVDGDKNRYATDRGFAFIARPEGGGVWHGHPIGWDDVPPDIREDWVRQRLVTTKQLKDWASSAVIEDWFEEKER
jgi:hypothetical protein